MATITQRIILIAIILLASGAYAAGSADRRIEPYWVGWLEIENFQKVPKGGLPEPDLLSSAWDGMNPVLKERIGAAMMQARLRGIEVRYLSGFRPRKYNETLKGELMAFVNSASNSRHISGDAVDVEILNKERLFEWVEILQQNNLEVPLFYDPNHIIIATKGGQRVFSDIEPKANAMKVHYTLRDLLRIKFPSVKIVQSQFDHGLGLYSPEDLRSKDHIKEGAAERQRKALVRKQRQHEQQAKREQQKNLRNQKRLRQAEKDKLPRVEVDRENRAERNSVKAERAQKQRQWRKAVEARRRAIQEDTIRRRIRAQKNKSF